jgi:PAS domain S-box-containing protein
VGQNEPAQPPPEARPEDGQGALLPVVGVGASAGGLAATSDLLQHLGPRPGAAIVVVHHLDPAHSSSLVEIFARVTPLPVATAMDGLRLERDRVYVVPPNAALSTSRGALVVTARPAGSGLHLPVDQFFEALAADPALQPLGVVLSGTGSDGTKGLQAINAAGGFTFAQDAGAEYRSMPENAVATGAVEFVGTPEQIAREVARIVARCAAPGERQADAGAFRRIVAALQRSSGIDFAYDIDAVTKGAVLLAEAREYAESVLDTVHECLVVLDGDRRVRSANRAFYQAFELTKSEAEGRLFAELGRGEWSLPALQHRIAALGEGERIDRLRVEQERARGVRRAFVVNARRIERTQSLLVALEDVTERERAADAQARSEIGLRDLLTSAAIAIVMTDESGMIAFANTMAEQIFGYAEGELLGVQVEALVPAGARATHVAHRAGFLASAFPPSLGKERGVAGQRKDGTVFPVELSLSKLQREGGALSVAFIVDISVRRASEERIRIYQERLQQMAFDAAVAEQRERRKIAADLHDRIGQSLALAQIKLSGVREELGGAPRVAVDEAIGLLAQSVADTRSLTFELSPPILYDLGLKAALGWLIDDLGKRTGLSIELSDDGLDKPLAGETAALVFRAVRELLVNVVKHAGVAAAKLSLRRAGDQFEIVIEDAGAGFAPAGKGPSSSGGYGLFSVREQLARLGGTVELASAPGQGTRVQIRVPLQPAQAPVAGGGTP